MAHADNLFSQLDSYASAKERFESRLAEAMSTRVPSCHMLRVRINGDGVMEFIKAELQEDLLGVNIAEENSSKP